MTLPWLFVAALYVLTPVSVDVLPLVSMAPTTIRLLVIVPRHAQNRRLCYGYDGPELKQHCEDLPGETARRVFTVYWDLRTSGEYQAVAIVTRNEAGRLRSYVETRPCRVIGVEP